MKSSCLVFFLLLTVPVWALAQAVNNPYNFKTGSISVSVATPPVPVTNPATSLTPASATLNGEGNPQGSPTEGWFQWGLTVSYTDSTPKTALGSGISSVPFSQTLAGLTPNETYHFRAMVRNDVGDEQAGSDLSFATPPALPPVVFLVTPGAGTEAGGTAVVIQGVHFTDPGAGSTLALFDGNPAGSLFVVDDTTITCTTPAGTGTVAVQVVNDLGPSNADVTYSYLASDTTLYRTFETDSLAFAVDKKGKYKSVKKKADKVEFDLFIVNRTGTKADALHMEFSHEIIPGTLSSPKFDSVAMGVNPHKWDFGFGSVAPDETVHVHGFGNKGKPQKVPKWWWQFAGVIVEGIQKTVTYDLNLPRLPMPNLHNLGEELYGSNQASFFPSGLKIGLGGPHSVVLRKYKDLQKTLNKNGRLHQGPPRCLNTFDRNGKAITKEQRNLPADKHDNVLLAEAITLKINIAASASGKTPSGFGELKYDDGTGSANPLNGKLVKNISAQLDSFMTLCPASLKGLPIDSLIFYTTVRNINKAFSGPMDTISFSTKLVLPGVRVVDSVEYLHFSGIPAVTVAPMPNPDLALPEHFTLYQNYPNPFNPTTTISFVLMEPSVVSIKVYNLLGQEVATLLDHEEMDEGEQSVDFDASALSSGVYLYRFASQGYDEDGVATQSVNQMKKMILVK